jgi:hypothetical protein
MSELRIVALALQDKLACGTTFSGSAGVALRGRSLVAMKIGVLSHGQRSIDDFARKFFGVDDGSFITHTYTFHDVVEALNAVQPYD